MEVSLSPRVQGSRYGTLEEKREWRRDGSRAGERGRKEKVNVLNESPLDHAISN